MGSRGPCPPNAGQPPQRACTSASGAPGPGQQLPLPDPAGYEETLTRLAAILAKHFADTRIVGTGEVPCGGLGGLGWGGP